MKLDGFFAMRRMRAAIAKDTRLQPDHPSFDKKLASQLLRNEASGDPRFAHTYSVFIEIFESLWLDLASLGLSAGNRTDIVKHVISLCMVRGHALLDAKRSDSLIALARPITSADVHSLRSVEGADGNLYTTDEILEAIFDLLKTVVDYGAYLATYPDKQREVTSTLDFERLFSVFHEYSVCKTDWEECLWLGNDVDINEPALRQVAPLASRAIGLSREFSLRFQHTLREGSLAQKVAKHRFLSGRIKSSRKTSRDFEKFKAGLLEQITYPFLSGIVARELRKNSKAWRVIHAYMLLNFISLGNVNRVQVPLPTESFAFDIDEFKAFLSDQLAIKNDELEDILAWLVYEPGQRMDIFLAPLYVIEGRFILFYPMCAYGNFEWFVESVVSRLNLDDLGNEFERYVSSQTRKAARGAAFKEISIVGPTTLNGENGSEEVDLIIVMKDGVFVGEVKYDCFAADEINVYQHMDKMRRACEQAARKAEFIQLNWKTLVSRLALPMQPTEVLPFALTEKPFLSGFSYRGVPIIALRDFEDFFDGEIVFNVTIGRDRIPSGGEIVKTYRSAATMAEDLRTYLRGAPRAAKFVERLNILELNRSLPSGRARGYRRLQFEVR